MWKRNSLSPNNQTLFRSQNLLTKTRFQTFAEQFVGEKVRSYGAH